MRVNAQPRRRVPSPRIFPPRALSHRDVEPAERRHRRHIAGPQIPEGVLNRIEAGIRAYDPCLSCATHAVGQMPLVVTLVGPGGAVLDEVRR